MNESRGRSVRMRGGRLFGMPVVTAVVVGLVGVSAAAAAEGDTYSGCINPTGYLVNVAVGEEPSKPCNDDAMLIQFSQTGPQGPQGDLGAMGPQGEVGPQGPQGLPGEQGPQGLAGEVGRQGLPGEVGPQGPQGDPGAMGLQGEVGPQGDPGAMGPQGEVGPQGPQGDPAAAPVLSYYRVDREASANPGRMKSLTASCNEGDILTGGGYAISAEFEGRQYRVNSNAPRSDVGLDWFVRIENLDDTALTFHAKAICLHVEQ